VKRHVFHPQAAEEYTAAVQYYRGIDPELGNRFYDEGTVDSESSATARVVLEV
jgi:hypothetical protein